MHPSPTTTSASAAVASLPCARLDNVSKLFGSFAALRQVTVDLEPGRCYVLDRKSTRLNSSHLGISYAVF